MKQVFDSHLDADGKLDVLTALLRKQKNEKVPSMKKNGLTIPTDFKEEVTSEPSEKKRKLNAQSSVHLTQTSATEFGQEFYDTLKSSHLNATQKLQTLQNMFSVLHK